MASTSGGNTQTNTPSTPTTAATISQLTTKNIIINHPVQSNRVLATSTQTIPIVTPGSSSNNTTIRKTIQPAIITSSNNATNINIVKNLLSNSNHSSNLNAAAVAVTAAANIYNLMLNNPNTTSQSNSTTTTATTIPQTANNNNNNTLININVNTNSQPTVNSTPPTTVTLTSSTTPKPVSVNNHPIVTTLMTAPTTNTAQTPANQKIVLTQPTTKPIPISLKTTNTLNYKSLSPLSFLNDSSQKISNISLSTTGAGRKPSQSTSITLAAKPTVSSTTTSIQPQTPPQTFQYLNNIVNLSNQNILNAAAAAAVAQQAIAQFCTTTSNPSTSVTQTTNSNSNSPSASQLLSQFQLKQTNQTTNPSTTTTSVNSNISSASSSPMIPQLIQSLPPMRLITTTPTSTTTNTTTATTTLLPTTVTATVVNPPQSILSTTLLNTSQIVQSSSSPSSSPLKPNIIRKARRDSPSSHSNANIISNNTDHIYNINHHPNQTIKELKHSIFELNADSIKSLNAVGLSSIPIPTTLLPTAQTLINSSSTSSVASSSSTSLAVDSNQASQTPAQLLSIASSSSSTSLNQQPTTQVPTPTQTPIVSSSSSASPSSSNTVNSLTKSIGTIINESLSEVNPKTIRKFSLTPKERPVSPANLPSSSSQPTSSAEPTPSTNIEQQQTRKRRKQEFKKQQLEDTLFNTNPLSNNSALAYSNLTQHQIQNPNLISNRYLNENTNIKLNQTNLTNLSIKESKHLSKLHQQQNLKPKEAGNLLSIKHSEYFEDSLSQDDLAEPVVKMPRLVNSINSSAPNAQAKPAVERNKKPSASLESNLNQFDSNSNKNQNDENLACCSMVDSSQQTDLIASNHIDNSLDSSNDSYIDDEAVELLSKEFSYIDSEGFRWTTKRAKSQMAISKCYKPTWKPKSNHFVRYSDIKLTKENNFVKPLTTTITHKELVENLNEWKFHYVISQVNNLIDYENESLEVMNEVENFIQNKNFIGFSDICYKISESIKANSQRHKYINEQLDETQLLIHKLFEHKEKYKNYLIVSSTGQSSSNPATLGTSSSSHGHASISSTSQGTSNSFSNRNNNNFTASTSKKKQTFSQKSSKNINTRSNNTSTTSKVKVK